MSYKTIISAENLINSLQDENTLVFDCRCDIKDTTYGIQAYTEGHIPGSIYVNVDTDLASEKTPSSGRHPLPDADALSEKLSQWGLSSEKQAVIYDDASGAFAGRMWWILKWLGHKKVAVLDGGLGSYMSIGGKLTTDETIFEKNIFTPNIQSEMVVEITDVEEAQYKMNKLIIDARSKERYLGIKDLVDPIAGHVPGAISHPLSLNLNKDGKFRSPEDLKLAFDKIIADTTSENVISMCGSGITACHNILAMEIAGIKGIKLYVGSWSEWITDKSRPIANIDN
ncbi:MAG: sulfurtransferase [Gammaproteobacteria bacterium]|nr:sulfurtransferase [Gammaproteobacteria bacterium]